MPWCTCVQGACHISLEIFWWRLQLWFRPHLNQNFGQEVMGFQHGKSFSFENFGTSDLGVMGKMTFGCNPHDQSQRYYKGEGGGFPQIQAVVSLCMLMACPCIKIALIMHSLTNLLFGLCRSIWIIDPLVTCPNPHLKASACPSYLRNVTS